MAPKTSEVCNKSSIHRRRANRDEVEAALTPDDCKAPEIVPACRLSATGCAATT